MTEYTLTLDPAAARFYRRVAAAAGMPVEQVMADLLFRLAAGLSLELQNRKP